MAQKTAQVESETPIVSFKTSLHKLDVMRDRIVLSKSLPHTERAVPYNEIVSVEHRRLVDYGQLKGVAVGLVAASLLLFVQFFKDLLAALILEVGLVTGSMSSTTIDASVRATADQAGMWLAALLILAAGYYAAKFIFSFSQRLVIYRTGRKPLSFPFPLTGVAMEVLAKIHEKVKAARGISKEEAEQILGDQVRLMLDQRVKMQKTLVESLQRQLKAATTAEERDKVKEMAREGVEKLEMQDQVIDRELRKTGLKKEDIFKKYRIKAPDESFIDSIMQGAGEL